jgi:hypothetical protein
MEQELGTEVCNILIYIGKIIQNILLVVNQHFSNLRIYYNGPV